MNKGMFLFVGLVPLLFGAIIGSVMTSRPPVQSFTTASASFIESNTCNNAGSSASCQTFSLTIGQQYEFIISVDIAPLINFGAPSCSDNSGSGNTYWLANPSGQDKACGTIFKAAATSITVTITIGTTIQRSFYVLNKITLS